MSFISTINYVCKNTLFLIYFFRLEIFTLKDIAQALNLSTSTVSRALRDSYEINPATKKLVVDFAAKINYRPNPIALSLKENKSRSIGVIVPEIANQFFSQAINGIEDEAYQRGYHVVIFQSHELMEREIQNVNHLYARRVDGLLIALSGSTTNIDHILNFSNSGFPVVYFDRIPVQEKVNKVQVDNFEGAYNATQFLIKKGKKKIAHITNSSILSPTVERLAGYKKALEDNGIIYDENLVKYCGFDPKEAIETIHKLVDDHNPDAFFSCSDRLALNCYEALQNRFSEINDHYLFIGFTNLNIVHLLNPPIHSVVQPAYKIGLEAARILLNGIEHPKKFATVQDKMLKTEMKIW